jgi:hypothetical protein
MSTSCFIIRVKLSKVKDIIRIKISRLEGAIARTPSPGNYMNRLALATQGLVICGRFADTKSEEKRNL